MLFPYDLVRVLIYVQYLYLELRREAVVKLFPPPFGCDLVRPPYVVIISK